MTKVLVLGANGQIAHWAIDLFLERGEVKLTLFCRRAKRLQQYAGNPLVEVVEGDVLDAQALATVMPGHDVVYANLAGDLVQMAWTIVITMKGARLKRLVFISSMGIYNEVPGAHYDKALDPYRDAAAVIESSDLDYTILRPSWLSNRDEIEYGITQKGEDFRFSGDLVSRKSVADLVVQLATVPGMETRRSLGVHRDVGHGR
ncbi:NAD(P)H-binding protein [Rhodoferax sp.]|uniref:NAD(P)H-binding protein n=1 Tax=Rhodoferax sp. TaxID=50421 RepID=UPI00283DE134|nr:NAD(P)H-binding protein [Rhodoferax sp.]MDR3369692.1 NAD(P)H-binding protein [Rhodoferax sp.]